MRRKRIAAVFCQVVLSFFIGALFMIPSCGGGGGGIDNLQPQGNPAVTSVSPGNGATGVSRDTKITVTFDSEMNSSTINTTTFTASTSGGPLPGTVSYDPSAKTAVFTPTLPVPPLTDITVTLAAAIRDINGNPLSSPYTWSFTTLTGFLALDFTNNTSYFVNATKVAEGTHCYIYLEQGQSVDQPTIDAIKNEFDNNIYPGDTTAFGDEPNPGVDANPKIYILLLDIKDGYNGTTITSFVGGYFSQLNEYSQDQNNPATNLKEMLYMDVNPVIPGSADFYGTLAHEFQHMIHWEQKTKQRNLNDDIWLNEAMSTVARTYCGLGPDYSSVFTYESAPSNSLTKWDKTVEDYGVVYMWAQYYKDRVGSDIFWEMLHNNRTGIDSVNNALTAVGYSKDFTGAFRDWAIANFSGNSLSWTGHPEWSYVSINTWPGTYNGITLNGLFNDPSKWNVNTLQPLDMWSVDYYGYSPVSGTTGSVTWNPASPSDRAAVVDSGNALLYYDMTVGTPYSYDTYGYLIAQNPSGISGGGDGITYASKESTLKSPAEILEAAGRNPIARALARETGKPQAICIQSYFSEREKELRSNGARPAF